MLRRPCGRAMRSKGRVGVDAVASKPGVAKEVLPLTRRILRLRLLKGGSWGEYYCVLRTHGLKSGACRRPETERQSLSPRPSHDSVRRSESSLHTTGPPVLLNSIIGTPGGRYMRLVTPLRAPLAAPTAPSHRGGLVHKPTSATDVQELTLQVEIQCAIGASPFPVKLELSPDMVSSIDREAFNLKNEYECPCIFYGRHIVTNFNPTPPPPHIAAAFSLYSRSADIRSYIRGSDSNILNRIPCV